VAQASEGRRRYVARRSRLEFLDADDAAAPCAAPTKSSSSKTAASPKNAPATELLELDGVDAQVHGHQYGNASAAACGPAHGWSAFELSAQRELSVGAAEGWRWPWSRDHESAGVDLTRRTVPAEVSDKPLMISAMARLSVAHREVLRRAYYSRCTTAQIATDLNISDSLVKSRLHCALRALDLNMKRIIADGRP
jgi:Sigma-70, region 4